ncbi:hypothetical protein ACF0H5_005221 [Mactra antiquata]
MSDRLEVERRLKGYPSLFISLPAAGVSHEQLLIDKLQDEDFEDTNLQETRAQNLVSYAYFVTGEKAKAYELNEEALHQHPSNILALSNKAWYLLKEEKVYDAEQVISTIGAIPEKEEEILVANGELAYAYARFGLETYDLAVKEYENVLTEYKQRQLSDKYNKYFCMWSFGLFLLLHRKRKDSKVFTEAEELLPDKRLQILKSVTKIPTRDKIAMKYQGKCHANICRILYDQVCSNLNGREKYIQLRQEPLSALEDAYRLGYDDVYTLDLIGKFMRYYHEKVQVSIQCLQRSIALRETSKGYHRLALALKREMESVQYKNLPKRQWVPNANVINLMKCPKKPSVTLVRYKHKPNMKEIMKNLDRAVELDRRNMDAYYDYGLTLRQINEHLKAKEKFEHIVKFKEGPRTFLQVANAYEQIGFCLIDALQTGNFDSAEIQSFQCEMQSSYKKSVEMSCSLLRMVPSLQQRWSSTPSLHQLLDGIANISPDCKELSFLSERLRSQSALDILKELRNVTGDLSRNDQRITDILNDLLVKKQYDDAAVLIGLVTCIPRGFEAINEKLYTKILIQGGLQAYEYSEPLLGRVRITEALTFKKHKVQAKNEVANTEIITEDIANLQGTAIVLLYDNESSKYAAESIAALLNKVGVITHVRQPSYQMTIDKNKSTMINYIVVVDGNNAESSTDDIPSLDQAMENLTINNFQTNVDLILEDLGDREYGNLLVVTLQDNIDVSAELRDFPIVVFNAEKERHQGSMDEDDSKFVAEILQIMALD